MTTSPVFRAKFIGSIVDVPVALLLRHGPYVLLSVYYRSDVFYYFLMTLVDFIDMKKIALQNFRAKMFDEVLKYMFSYSAVGSFLPQLSF